jgi:hypothetical protein
MYHPDPSPNLLAAAASPSCRPGTVAAPAEPAPAASPPWRDLAAFCDLLARESTLLTALFRALDEDTPERIAQLLDALPGRCWHHIQGLQYLAGEYTGLERGLQGSQAAEARQALDGFQKFLTSLAIDIEDQRQFVSALLSGQGVNTLWPLLQERTKETLAAIDEFLDLAQRYRDAYANPASEPGASLPDDEGTKCLEDVDDSK